MKMVLLRSLAFIVLSALIVLFAARAVFGDEDAGKISDGEAAAPVKEPEKKAQDSPEAQEDKKDRKSEKSVRGSRKAEKPEPAAAEVKEHAPAIDSTAAAAERARFLKTVSTPFNTASIETATNDSKLTPMSLRPGSGSLRTSLSSRLVPNRVYFPGSLVIGKPAEFVVKARPGSHVAIAMADKDAGARPLGQLNLRLGPDRKLVAAGTIPDSGVLSLIVDMPIQGDLIGLPVFFETVIWKNPDFSDLELAAPVKSESAGEIADKENAIIVAGEKNQKRGPRFVTESVTRFQQNAGLDSGRP
jgi:hypothetical protein